MRMFENIEEMTKEVGKEIGVSDWVQIDQDRINLFAEATGDHQWIHLDGERTQKELGMPTIAHGYLTLSLLPMLQGSVSGIKSVTRGINYGSNKVRFTGMVPVDSKVRARVKLVNMEPKSGGMQMTNEVTMEVEGSDRPAMVAETLSLVFE
ncbi:MaoC family dehydratase [Candidatus Phaeomarinobacter ectocarpi]|uniref:MaoC family dehydratase n=1 Tax=Candidatus Phaeomarinibacter ectocarpi TaxID=1458461 RepID=X5MMR2_9HYPH|nr:MaoC family dehydratase [Candidatus Phaeomarinobacter ectocarpi]CDO60625.1 MaoC family dehydratase [Candidatus Phaeomarinobacter ectocarpi]